MALKTPRVIGIIAALALLTSACSSSDNKSDDTSGPVKGTVKIINWVSPATNAVVKQINSDFEKKYPGVKVDYQLAANTAAGYQTLLQTSVQSGNADIVTLPEPVQPYPLKATRTTMTPAQNWVASDLFEPLNGQTWLKNYSKTALDTMTYKDKTYGIPTGSYQAAVIYNKDIFAKYNLQEPKTYSEFVKVLETLKSNKVVPLWLGAGSGAAFYITRFLTSPLIGSIWAPEVEGGDVAKALNSGKAKWTDPKFIEVLQKLNKIGSYLEPGYAGVAWQQMPADFAAGKSAMLLDGSFDLGTIQKLNPKMNIGSFALPGSDDASKNQVQLQPDLTFGVLKSAKNKPAALAYLEFFAQSDVYKKYVDATGISPTQESGTYDNVASKILGDNYGKGVLSTTAVPVFGANQGFYTTAAQFPVVEQKVISGKLSPEKAAALIQKSWKTQ